MKLNNPNINILSLAVKQLGGLVDEVVFVGGCATGLLITDPAAAPIRVTKDVDVIVQITTPEDYRSFTKQLKQRGFKEDTSKDAPICRWNGEEVILDIMPTDESILGFSNLWYSSAFDAANLISLNNKCNIRLISAPYFLMTKCDAFDNRGKGDYYSSHDIEDIIAVIDGRSEIVSDVMRADNDLKSALVNRFQQLIKSSDFMQALSGHLLPDEASQKRISIIVDRMNSIVGIEKINEE